jgi:hypothetical protein
MIEISFYAPGLREGENVLNIGHSLELLPGVHYHVDTIHDVVYFDMESPVATVAQLSKVFTDVGIEPRVVGKLPEELALGAGGDGTVRTD